MSEDSEKILSESLHAMAQDIKERDAEIERLRGELDAASLEVQRLERLVWTPMNAYSEIERLRAEVEPLRIALGLLTTIKPTMEIDIADPVGMAQQIASHVADEIERLRRLLRELLDNNWLPDSWSGSNERLIRERVREALGND